MSGWQNLHPDVKSVIYVNRQSTKRTGLLGAFSIDYALIVQQEKYRRCRRERFESVKGRGSSATKRSVWSERKMTKILSDTQSSWKDTLTSTVVTANSIIGRLTSGKERKVYYWTQQYTQCIRVPVPESTIKTGLGKRKYLL